MNSKKVPSTDVSNPKPYWNPYIAGVCIGLTLLTTFVLVGRGLGASGGLTTLTSLGAYLIAPDYSTTNSVYISYLENEGRGPFRDWILIEIIGVVIGGFISGRLAGRFKSEVNKGPRISTKSRLGLAFSGGIAMGFAAKLARGCTSGLVLSGGSTLSLGSWLFILMLFAGAYGAAYFVRKEWT